MKLLNWFKRLIGLRPSMHQFGPGAYVDRKGTIHFSTKEMCQHFGVPATKLNRQIAQLTAMRAMNDACLKAARELEDELEREVEDAEGA